MLFELKQSLNLKLQQQLVMTPQLQQAIRLLQLSRLELVDAIQAELEQNPALEEELRPDKNAIEDEAAIHHVDAKELAPAPEPRDKPLEVKGDNQNANDIDWQQWLETYNSTAPQGVSYKQSTEELPNLEQTLTRSETLQEHLLWQLGLMQMVEADASIAAEIIGALDDNGFLTGERPCEDIAIRLNVSVEHVERVLKRVQEFDPIGIAARDLTECLLIQLYHFNNDNKLAERLIVEFMSEL